MAMKGNEECPGARKEAKLKTRPESACLSLAFTVEV
jgi:hypothetical protein